MSRTATVALEAPPVPASDPKVSTAAPRRRRRIGYRPELDGFRAIAILAVMLFHSDKWLPGVHVDGGAVGVDLFFVLSGFLITSLLLEERQNAGSIDRPNFYARRALRLLPALFLALILGAFVTASVGGNGKGGMPYPHAALAALFFAGNWFQYKLGVPGHT